MRVGGILRYHFAIPSARRGLKGRVATAPHVRGSRRRATDCFAQLFVPNVEFIVMPSRVGERARGAGLSSDCLGIIKARSGTEAIRHRAEIFLFSDLPAPLF
jgi:hypothetical protein